jgi:hypothetical protein
MATLAESGDDRDGHYAGLAGHKKDRAPDDSGV